MARGWGKWVIVCAAVVGAAGCGRGLRRTEGRPLLRFRAPEVKLHPTEARVDAVIGTVLVMPVALDGPAPTNAKLAAKVDDGRKVEAQLYWVSVRPDGGVGGWLPPAGQWAATLATAGSRPSATGSWVVVADLPMDAAGQGLTIAGQRFVLNWVADAGLVQPVKGEGPWRPPIGEDLPASLKGMIAAEAASPARRWRYRLLTCGLNPAKEEATFADPVLEALARQTEARWQAALAALWIADPELAERVKRRLAAVVDAGGGVVAPAWPTDSASLDALLADLLNRRLEAAQKAERGAAWLELQPGGAAWVADDAGLRDAGTGRPLATCGVANLLDRATLAWASAGAESEPELTTLQPFSIGQVSAPVAGEESPGVTPVEVHAGRWSAMRVLARGRIPAAPPGVRIEGLMGDWTMGAWLSGVPDDAMTGEAAWMGAALLRRGGDEDGWWFYGEFRSPGMKAESDEGASETVRVWLGPSGHPTAVLRASSGGVVTDEGAVDQGVGSLRGAMVRREAGKWIVQVPVPARCVESDGTIRVAVERRDARGRRSAWPRPMLPWQIEPGRVGVDTGAWGDASAAK